VSVSKNSAIVNGNGTEFTAEDVNRRIVIGNGTYLIKSVQDAQTIALAAPYPGESDESLSYALGGKLVGPPWEVKLPTNLIKLDNSLVFPELSRSKIKDLRARVGVQMSQLTPMVLWAEEQGHGESRRFRWP